MTATERVLRNWIQLQRQATIASMVDFLGDILTSTVDRWQLQVHSEVSPGPERIMLNIYDDMVSNIEL